ncbi:MAG TPA: hypothetical protein VK861_01625 [Bacteroidales bacterium]|nr:hypothetical protein [Bacteroidales bacterium]
MKYVVIILAALFTCTLADGQNLVGYNAAGIRNYMAGNSSDLRNVKVTNDLFRYLKYTDYSDNQTILFFLSADSVCRNIRMIYDPSLRKNKIMELNSSYKRIDESKWLDNRDGKEFLVEMFDEQWSLVVTIGPKQ